jgi:hypothetical protein
MEYLANALIKVLTESKYPSRNFVDALFAIAESISQVAKAINKYSDACVSKQSVQPTVEAIKE